MNENDRREIAEDIAKRHNVRSGDVVIVGVVRRGITAFVDAIIATNDGRSKRVKWQTSKKLEEDE